MLLTAAFCAALTVAPASAQDRLVEACEVAVDVHADRVDLEFPSFVRTGNRIELEVAFHTGERRYVGAASCEFVGSPGVGEVPSLIAIDALGQSGPAMFLMSHHAIWSHFTGHGREAFIPEFDKMQDDDEDESRPSRRRLLAATE